MLPSFRYYWWKLGANTDKIFIRSLTNLPVFFWENGYNVGDEKWEELMLVILYDFRMGFEQDGSTVDYCVIYKVKNLFLF